MSEAACVSDGSNSAGRDSAEALFLPDFLGGIVPSGVLTSPETSRASVWWFVVGCLFVLYGLV